MERININPKELFISILQIKVPNPSKIPVTNKIAKYFENYKEPTLQDIQKVYVDSKSFEIFLEGIESIGFKLPFNIMLLQESLTIYPTIPKSEKKSLDIFFLYSTISWVIEYNKTDSYTNFDLVLKSLTFISEHNFLHLSSSLFCFLLPQVISKHEHIEFNYLWDPLYIFYYQKFPICEENSFPLVFWLSVTSQYNEEEQMSKDTQNLLIFISQILEERTGLEPDASDICFSKNDIDIILKKIEPFIEQLDVLSLSIFLKLLQHSKYSEKIISNLPSNIYSFCLKMKFFFGSISIDKIKIDFEEKKNSLDSLIFNFNDNNEPKKETLYNIDEVNSIPDIPSDLLTRLKLLLRIPSNYNKKLKDGFIDVLNNCKEEYYLQMLYIFIYMASNFPYSVELLDFVEYFFDSFIFNPKITIFNDKYLEIYQIRNFIIKLIYNQYFTGELRRLFLKHSNYSDFNSEIFFYLSNQKNPMNSDIIQLIYQLLILFQDYDFDHIKYFIFDFFDSILKTKEDINEFISSTHFPLIFLKFFFQISLQESALKLFKNTIINVQYENLSKVAEIYQTVFLTLLNKIKDKYTLPLLTNLLNILTYYSNKNTLYPKYFLVMNELLIIPFNSLTSSETSKQYMKEVLLFYAVISDYNKIQQTESKLLSSTIISIEGNQPTEEISDLLLNLISGNRIISKKTNFLIRQPRILTVLTDVLNNDTNKLIEKLHYIYQLCKFSTANSHTCHEGEFDLTLIDIITKNPKNKELLNISFSLLKLIASIASSIQVVQQFISLFCPIEQRYVSPFLIQAMETMNKIVLKKKNIPTAYLPLSDNSPNISIYGLTENIFLEGFTVAYWLCIDSGVKDISSNILSLGFDNNEIALMILDSTLFIRVQLNSQVLYQKIDKQIPGYRWIFLTISFQLDQYKRLQIKSSVNDQQNEIKYFSLSSFEFKKNRPIKCMIDKRYGIYINPSNEAHSILSSFELYQSDIIDEICQKLPKDFVNSQIDFDHNPIIYIKTESDNFILSLKSNVINSSIKAVLKGENVIVSLPFAEILIRYFKLQVLIPLFAQLNLLNPDNTKPEPFIKQVITLFFNAMKVNLNICFVDSKEFQLVSYLLMHSPELLTYDVYKYLYEIFIDLPNDIQILVFQELLFNYRLWYDSDKETMEKISENWSKKLIPKYHQYTNLQFHHYVEQMRLLFWINKDYSKNTRKNLINVLYLLSKTKKLTVDDFSTLLLSAISFEKFTLSIDFLKLISKIAKEKNSPFLSVKKYWEHFICLDLAIQFDNEDITFQLLKTIFILNKSLNYLEKKLECFLSVFIRYLSNSHYTTTFLKKLIDFSINNPSILSIICSFILQNDEELDEIIYNNLKPSFNYCFHKSWSFWPAYAAIKRGGKMLDFLINFMVKCSGSVWNDILAMIIMISNIFDYNYSIEAPQKFLLEIGNFILNSKNDKEDFINTYLQYSFFYMFYTTDNLPYKNYYYNSPFYEKINKKVEKFLPFMDCLQEMEEISHGISFQFGFKIDLNNKWLDSEIALQCINIIIKKKIIKFSGFGIFLCSLLLKDFSLDIINPKKKELLKFGNINDIYINFYENSLKEKDKNKLYLTDNINQLVYPPIFKALEILFSNSNETIRFTISRCAYRMVAFQKSSLPLFENFIGSNKYQILRWCEASSTKPNFIIERSIKNKKKQWEQLWRQLTYYHQPWSNAIKQESPKWKRDSTLCTYFCPMKVTPNTHFDDHKVASFCRDTGSILLAKKMTEEIKKQNQINTQAPPELLEIDNEVGVDNFKKPLFNKFKKGKSFINESSKLITIKSTKNCQFNVYKNMIRLKMENNNKIITILAKDIKMILLRNVYHLPNAIEIFTESGKSYLIKFDQLENHEVLQKISILSDFKDHCIIQTSSFIKFFKATNSTELWQDHKISNFDYLMRLNIFSSRSFSDASAYPIMPWVLKDFTSETLDLTKEESFRDLSIPIGLYEKSEKNLKVILGRYKDMCKTNPNTAFLFSSYIISPLCVYLWLMRLEPFTSLHIDLQSGKFDHAARLFASIPDSFNLILNHSNDFRELIPEFFFQYEFLVNLNEFDLGTVDGKQVNDVLLPKWANVPYDVEFKDVCEWRKPDPKVFKTFNFLYMHRKALESEYVSKNLHKWIDIIWGNKQRGYAPLGVKNVYDPMMYCDSWDNVSQDQIEYRLIEATKQNCGQVPIPLFINDHPIRNNIKNNIKRETIIYNTNVKDIKYFGLMKYRNKDLSILLYTKNGLFYTAHINNTIKVQQEKAKIDSNIITDFTVLSNYKIAVSTIHGYVNIITPITGEIETLYCHFGRINCIDSSSHYIVTGGNDTVINCFLNEENYPLIYGKSSFQASITCIDVSQQFHIIVSCNRNGSIIIFKLESGELVRALNINGRPIKVIITKAWGFIIVYATELIDNVLENVLYLFSVNGEMIRSRKIPFRINKWTLLKSNDDFDYIICSDDNDNVYLFEAFYLNAELPFASFDKLCGLKFCNGENMLIAVENSGCIKLLQNCFDIV